MKVQRQARQLVSFLVAFIVSFEIVAHIHPLVSNLTSWNFTRPAAILGATGHGTAVGGPPPQKVKWRDMPSRHPIRKMEPMPQGNVTKIPEIQADFLDLLEPNRRKILRKRTEAVKKAFQHSWKGYRAFAWLHDEIRPVTAGTNDPLGGWAATLVDSLDTLLIMDMDKDFRMAVAAIEKIDFSVCNVRTVNLFETTIRYLGGLLGAYDLSEGRYPILLEKASEIGDMLYCAFDTKHRMPVTRWDWAATASGMDQDPSPATVLAEIGTLSLEFTRLTQLTGDLKYYDAVRRVTNYLSEVQFESQLPGLWPGLIDAANLRASVDNVFTFGGMADSAYEYLPKQWMLLGGGNPTYRFMYEDAMKAAKTYLLIEPLIPERQLGGNSTLQTGTRQRPFMFGTATTGMDSKLLELEASGEHLTCFAGGMTALAARAFSAVSSTADLAKNMDLARGLAETCYWAYENTKIGIAPEHWFAVPCRIGQDAWTEGEVADFDDHVGGCEWSDERWRAGVASRHNLSFSDRGSDKLDDFILRMRLQPGFTDFSDRRYMLRPETIETLFVLYRTTADPIYQEQAWTIFQAIDKHAKTKVSYATVRDVTVDVESGAGTTVELEDSTESFWTAETLKYFYLIFSDPSVVSLDEFVFNTEAHPLRWRYDRYNQPLRF